MMEASNSRTLGAGGLAQRKRLYGVAEAGNSKPAGTASPSLLTENRMGRDALFCRHAPEKPFRDQVTRLPINATDKAVTDAFQKERRILHLNDPSGPEKIIIWADGHLLALGLSFVGIEPATDHWK